MIGCVHMYAYAHTIECKIKLMLHNRNCSVITQCGFPVVALYQNINTLVILLIDGNLIITCLYM